MIQRFGVDRDQRAVGAGLPIGYQDVGVQVRVPAPRRLMLVGDPHKAGQAMQILHAGDRVVYPGVASMLM